MGKASMWGALAAIVLACSLAGCATTGASGFQASVAAISGVGFDPALKHKVVYEGAEESSDPVLQAVIDPTRRMLRLAGAALADPGPQAPADVVVTVSYVDEPTASYPRTTREPVYAQTGVASSRTVERVDKRGRKVATTTYRPQWEIVGYEEVEQPSNAHTRLLTLKAYDQRGGRRGYWPLWSLEVRCISGSGSGDRRLPYLLKAGQPFIGKLINAGAEVAWSDPDIAYIRDGGAAPSPAPRRGAEPR